MQQSVSWKTNSFPGSSEISRILWHPKIHQDLLKCPPSFLSWARWRLLRLFLKDPF